MRSSALRLEILRGIVSARGFGARSALGENPGVFSFLVNSSQLIASLRYTTARLSLNLSGRRAVGTATGFTTKETVPRVGAGRVFSCRSAGSVLGIALVSGQQARNHEQSTQGPKKLLSSSPILPCSPALQAKNRFLNFNQTSKAGAASWGERSSRHHKVPREPQQPQGSR